MSELVNNINISNVAALSLLQVKKITLGQILTAKMAKKEIYLLKKTYSECSNDENV